MCSLTFAQNEDVVERFLSLNPCAGNSLWFLFVKYLDYRFESEILILFLGYAELLEIDGSKCWPCKSGQIPKTLRFDPLTSRTSGLFVAKFTKKPERLQT